MEKYFLFIQTEKTCVNHLQRLSKSAKHLQEFLQGESASVSQDKEKYADHTHFSTILPHEIKERLNSNESSVGLSWETGIHGFNIFKDALSRCWCFTDTLEIEESDNLAADGIHFLADQLPLPGTFILDAIWFTHGCAKYPDDAVQLYGAFARLEAFHNGRIHIFDINSESFDDENLCPSTFIPWIEVLPSIQLLNGSFPRSMDKNVVWVGDLGILGERGEKYLTISDVLLSNERDNSLFNITRKGYPEEYDLQIDKEIQLLCAVNYSNIPLHSITVETLDVLFTNEDRARSFVHICQELNMQGICLFGCLRYGLVRKDCDLKHFRTDQWGRFVENTSSIDPLEIARDLNEQKLFILYSNTDNANMLRLTFMQDREMYDSQGIFDLHNKFLERTNLPNKDLLPDIPSPSQWPEKLAWINEEYKTAAKGSLMRFQSSDMMLAGIPVPSSDQGSDQRTLEELSKYFDKEGNPVKTDLKSIPLASDRLLKNICSADTVKALNFKEAKGFLAHGIEYCLDSMSSLKLDSRLTRIQTRYVVNDTLCSRNIPLKDEASRRSSFRADPTAQPKNKEVLKAASNNWPNIKGTKRKLRLTEKQSRDRTVSIDGAGEDLESMAHLSRSERHKKRLRLIAEAVVQKYGKVDKNHASFEKCVDRLYKLCKSFLKDLTTSKGLVEEMKRVAKINVKQVVEFEMKRKEPKIS